MKYYVNKNKEIFGFELDGSQDNLITEDMKEISLDPSLRQSGSVVEVEQPLRGKYLTVGCPMKFSAFTPDIKAAPLLGEHTAAVLQELGYSDDEIAAMKQNHAI